MLPLILYSFKDGNILNILPIEILDYKPILKGSNEALFSFVGFGMLLIIFPSINASSMSKLKITLFANLCTT
ncbi:GerAB/ArcD/ProY family transporter, partial [Bacillus sp. JJ722]|uniref:GerAB/ArcD/ProY family transporter n=1 Tax=Bacillus sp. JJ722 TaxID=3122973 RepID=UPI003F68B9FF